jgi:murein DD-endopeptidase MepM/ murein hydrolase activator NlpD
MMRFPLPFIPSLSYHLGGRRFGALRGNGRRHAACDLIAPLGTEVYAIDDGIVEVESAGFYRGTNSMAIRHKNGQVVRYCEILAKDSIFVPKNTVVRAGQLIAHVGKMYVDSMLHFELYSGRETGPLTQRKNTPYQRRADLIDPTPLLDRLAWTLHA